MSAPATGDPTRPGPGRSLRGETFNIRHGAGLDGRVYLERVARVIAGTGAHVVGLQEVDRHFHERSGFVDQAAWLARRLGTRVAFGAAVDVDPLSADAPRRQYGNALLSAHPILASTTVPLPQRDRPERRVLLATRLDVAGVVVRVVTTHLQDRAPEERRVQARALLEHVRRDDGPAVVLGDLNARPHAPEITLLTSELVDCWSVRGTGAGHTWDAGTPHARIDYVLVTPDLAVRSVATVPTDASDHLPVVAELTLPVPTRLVR